MAIHPAVRIILGSISDKGKASIVLKVLKEIHIPVKVSIASCHWNTGDVPTDDLVKYIRELDEDLIAFLGGMQLAAPGIIETINKVNKNVYKLVLVIPTDKIALHANLDFPMGTVVFSAGYNSINPDHGLINSALAIAKLHAWRYPEFRPDLNGYYAGLKGKKQLIKEVGLFDGMFPDPKNS